MNTYQTMRNAALAFLVASGSAQASEQYLVKGDPLADKMRELHMIEGDNLANKILQYEDVKKKEGNFLRRDDTANNVITYTIPGLQKLNSSGGLPFTQGAKVKVGRIVYSDKAPYGPSDGDELHYTIKIIYEDGSTKKITATDIRGNNSWATKKAQQRVLQRTDALPISTTEGYNADIVYITLFLDIEVEEHLHKKR